MVSDLFGFYYSFSVFEAKKKTRFFLRNEVLKRHKKRLRIVLFPLTLVFIVKLHHVLVVPSNAERQQYGPPCLHQACSREHRGAVRGG